MYRELVSYCLTHANTDDRGNCHALLFCLLQMSSCNDPFNCYYSSRLYLSIHQLFLHLLQKSIVCDEELTCMMWMVLLFHYRIKKEEISKNELLSIFRRWRENDVSYKSFLLDVINDFNKEFSLHNVFMLLNSSNEHDSPFSLHNIVLLVKGISTGEYIYYRFFRRKSVC